MDDVPLFISVDDHVLEPPHLWESYLPARHRDRGPKLVAVRGRSVWRPGDGALDAEFVLDDDGPEWADVWSFGGRQVPVYATNTEPGIAGRESVGRGRAGAVRYEEVRPGCFQQPARLADMDANHTQASLCFPTFCRFCGQVFLECDDRDLGLACLQAYNDWMIDEWCGDAAFGRLIPLTLIPLWDPHLAAREVRRCAAKGAHAIAFSEGPAKLGLPSIHSGYWNPLFEACVECDTVVNVHIGSSSTVASTSSDAPHAVITALTYQGAAHAFVDWLTSGLLERYPKLRLALTEGQVGWMPYLMERLDHLYRDTPAFAGLEQRLTRPPSEYIPGRIYGCAFNDLAGLRQRDVIGMSQIMFEIDYPHGDSTWPESKTVFAALVRDAGLDHGETWAFARGNAIECFGLARFGIER